MSKTAFITGITGQDASHLAELLVKKDYKVYGLARRSSTDNTWRIKHLLDKIEIVTGDLNDQSSLDRAIHTILPDEIYNLAAQSFVKASWDNPEFTFDTNAVGVIRLLEAMRNFGKKGSKFFQASTSEMFGKVQEKPQNEGTKFYPRSPYGVSKLAGHWAAINYRESYNLFISIAISFNHESYRRGLEFVSRKISYNVAKIHLGMADHIELGNLDSVRDFGYAPEFVEAFWQMLQLDFPTELVLSTGKTHSIRDFVKHAFKTVNIHNWQDYVKKDLKFMRPAEVNYLCGDSSKAREVIGWRPKIHFEEIVEVMVNSDIERLKRGDRFE